MTTTRIDEAALPPLPALPPGVRSRIVDNHNGLRMHVLEAGFEGGPRPAWHFLLTSRPVYAFGVPVGTLSIGFSRLDAIVVGGLILAVGGAMFTVGTVLYALCDSKKEQVV